LDFLEMNWQTRSSKLEQHSPLLTGPGHCKDKVYQGPILIGDESFLTTLYSARFLRFSQRNQPFPVSSTVPTSLPRPQAFSCPLTYAG